MLTSQTRRRAHLNLERRCNSGLTLARKARDETRITRERMRRKEGAIRHLNKSVRHIRSLATLKDLDISRHDINRVSALVLHINTEDKAVRIPLHSIHAVNGNEADAVGEKFIRLRVAVILADLDIGIRQDDAGRIGAKGHCGDEGHH